MVQIRKLIRRTTGIDLAWLSMFPGEAEKLLPPLSFMNPPGKSQEIVVDGFKLSVVEIKPRRLQCKLGIGRCVHSESA
jgi:hypothetical protein